MAGAAGAAGAAVVEVVAGAGAAAVGAVVVVVVVDVVVAAGAVAAAAADAGVCPVAPVGTLGVFGANETDRRAVVRGRVVTFASPIPLARRVVCNVARLAVIPAVAGSTEGIWGSVVVVVVDGAGAWLAPTTVVLPDGGKRAPSCAIRLLMI